MIVAQLIETLAPGGAENLAVQIANAWAERGHDSHLIVLTEAGPFRDRLSSAVHFHELNLPASRQSTLSRAPALLGALGRLNGILKTGRVEALQTHLPMANFFGLVTAWRRTCRVYPTVHNNREFDYGDRSGPFREKLRKRAYRMMLSRCNRVIAVSDQVKASMVSELGVTDDLAGKITVVPNGVPVPAPLDAEGRAEVRSALSIEQGEVLIAGVGRLTAQKNFADLVAALSGLDGEGVPWRCVVAGEGELRPDLETRVESAGLGARVSFPGHVAGMSEFLGAADIFCLPSSYEGLPLVLLEAMAAELPVVAYGIDGVTDVVENDRQALLAAPENVELLTGQLARLIADEGLRRRLGAAGRKLVEDTYGFDRVVDQLEKVCAH